MHAMLGRQRPCLSNGSVVARRTWPLQRWLVRRLLSVLQLLRLLRVQLRSPACQLLWGRLPRRRLASHPSSMAHAGSTQRPGSPLHWRVEMPRLRPHTALSVAAASVAGFTSHIHSCRQLRRSCCKLAGCLVRQLLCGQAQLHQRLLRRLLHLLPLLRLPPSKGC